MEQWLTQDPRHYMNRYNPEMQFMCCGSKEHEQALWGTFTVMCLYIDAQTLKSWKSGRQTKV